MYCNQCEQTAKGIACTVTGVCGKKPDVAALQDLLVYALKGLSLHVNHGRSYGIAPPEINHFTLQALFATLTNVNFDPEKLQQLIGQAVDLRMLLKMKIGSSGRSLNLEDPAADFVPAPDLADLIEQGEEIGFLPEKIEDDDIKSLQEIVLYSIKGIAAYLHHARLLGQEEEGLYDFIHETLALIGDADQPLEFWLEKVLKSGQYNLRAMELLDLGHTSHFGHPVPTSIPLGHRPGKCILVSGHDLKDLQHLLEITRDRDIDIYTHGEMLPAHGYPGLKKYRNLYGHYGTAWQNQRDEFRDFPGPILMTTNCLQEPRESYKDHIFTTGPVAWPGVKHLEPEGFDELVKKAEAMPGFSTREDLGSIMTGFAHNAVLGVADQIVAAVKSGDIKHFFLVGGCDGARPGRSYYSDLVEQAPADTVILTLACGKFRFFDRQLGDIGGIPRLLDIGQCNDAYSAIKIAAALGEVFECGVNDLPLSMVVSWYEQKAVSILCTLLYLGIKNIRLGPTLPAFVSPNVLQVLVTNYNLQPITTPEQDLAAMLG